MTNCKPVFLKVLLLGMVIIQPLWGAAEERPHWNNIDVIRENAEAPRAHYRFYESRAQAVAMGENRYLRSLNGTWKFHYADSPAGRPQDFFRPGFDDSDWADLPVPSNWERHGFGYPIYINVPYPFEIDEPNVPLENNPVGSYRRDFEVPADWSGRDVFIEFGAVSSAFYLWINGEYVGYSEGSKTESEFDITDVVRAGPNTVAVEVYRWSTGSYLEDQDFWSLSGIQRDVTVYARPKARVRDYFVRPSIGRGVPNGLFEIDVDLVNSGKETRAASIGIEVRDGDRQLFSTESGLALKPGSNTYDYRLQVSDVKPWSAEMPNLYTMYIELKDAQDNPLETIRQEIGFRSSKITNGRFRINNELVKLKGVNLHEHHDVTGHVVDEQTMLTDIRLMKGANLNAVRNSHYPQPMRWYELVSEHGLYMIDEANIESHGYGYDHDKTLGNKPHWKEHHLDRTRRMLERSKNYPAVVIWSLGNEAGDGVNLGATYQWIKSRDLSRPVQYETEGDIDLVGERHSDFHSSMYWRHWDLEEYAQTMNDRPFVLIEYAHSMGNSTGNLKEYWDVINSHDILAGGFIWDWVDQGLRETDEGGTPYWTYGGDYGPPGVPSSGNFNANGIIFSDRSVQPAYWEVKRAYQEVEFSSDVPMTGAISVNNNYDFRSLAGLEINWKLTTDGRVTDHGQLPAPDIAPRESKTLNLWTGPPRLGEGREHFLDVSLVNPKPADLQSAGHSLAAEQFLVEGAQRSHPAEDRSALPARVEMTEDDDRYKLRIGMMRYAIDKASGLLSSIQLDDRELMLNPLAPNFWRAPTDNDFGNYMGDWAGVWRDAASHRKLIRLKTRENPLGRWMIYPTFDFFDANEQKLGRMYILYVFLRDGSLHVQVQFEREDKLPEIPRIGMNMELLRDLDRVEWFGRGPHENYNDRNRSAHVGLYRNTVADHYVPYMRPQENGNKTDVRWFSLTDASGAGLKFQAHDLVEFSVHHNRMEDFIPPVKIAITSEDGEGARENTERVNIHVNDIKPRDLVSVNIDYGQMGVGGDDSWGKKTLQRYMLNERCYQYGFTIVPFRTEGSDD